LATREKARGRITTEDTTNVPFYEKEIIGKW
jgi:hypothetical protein